MDAVVFRLWPYTKVVEGENQTLHPWSIAACRGHPFSPVRAHGEWRVGQGRAGPRDRVLQPASRWQELGGIQEGAHSFSDQRDASRLPVLCGQVMVVDWFAKDSADIFL